MFILQWNYTTFCSLIYHLLEAISRGIVIASLNSVIRKKYFSVAQYIVGCVCKYFISKNY